MDSLKERKISTRQVWQAETKSRMLEKVGENAYKIKLPIDYGVSPTFNVADLSPYHGDEHDTDLRTSLLL